MHVSLISGTMEFYNQDITNESCSSQESNLGSSSLGSCLSLEVVSGPSRGTRCSVQSNTSRLPLTLGRVSPSDLLLKDGEVSGKHAMITWNSNKLKWELVDMGSLNGTLLNSRPINHPDSGIGMISDPMSLRRGGRKLPMEDVCYYQWPLPGIDQFGVFGICDGHGGVEAAQSASNRQLKLELKAAESKIKSYDAEISSLKVETRELVEKLENAYTKAQSFEGKARIMEQEKIYLEQKYSSEFERFAEVEERYRVAEKEARKATELADKARAESVAAQKEKSEIQRVAMERLSQIERAERQIENLEREKTDLENELHRIRVSEMDAVSKVALLEARFEEREKEIESLLKTNNEQRASTVKAAQAKLDSLQQELTSVRLNETALDSKLKATSHGKRFRTDDEAGVGSVQDVDMSDRILRANKKSKSTTSPLRHSHLEDGGSVFKGDDVDDNQNQQDDYTKFTVQKLKQELTKHNFGAELLALRNPNKKDILTLHGYLIVVAQGVTFALDLCISTLKPTSLKEYYICLIVLLTSTCFPMFVYIVKGCVHQDLPQTLFIVGALYRDSA
ncbi:Protein phosphatase 2C 70 [Hibiscus syriacus]|uniref:Protein phosphatase 2C 70 n=1 Tax=Hibiscus syriacus TaxID=106335 RepID=A0A6A3CXD8_HIBSY|nr:Protein phosphatase 2C 70 [Hibiscus syriacus]